MPYDIECLHCGKRFKAERPLRASSESQAGFKCPHCGLLVSRERAELKQALEPPESQG